MNNSLISIPFSENNISENSASLASALGSLVAFNHSISSFNP